MKIYYRLSIAAEKEVLAQSAALYDGLIVNANVGVWGRTWIPLFISSLGKPYYIDPRTDVFAHNVEAAHRNGDTLKKSFEELREWLPRPLSDAMDTATLLDPGSIDFNAVGTGGPDDIPGAILRMQRQLFRADDHDQTAIDEYYDFLGEDRPKRNMSPAFIVPPYFWFSSPEDPWFDINRRMLAATRGMLTGEERMLASICMTQDALLDEKMVEATVNAVEGVEHETLWVSGLNQTQVTSTLLERVAELIRSLDAKGTEVMMSYGGFLCVLMGKVGLAGVSSGLAFGEYKEMTAQTRGGRYSKRWYYPELHDFITEATFRSMFSDHPGELTCDCPFCERAMELAAESTPEGTPAFVDRFMEVMQRDDLTRHFMHCRRAEVEHVETSSVRELIDGLNEFQAKAQRLNFSQYEIPFQFMDSWKYFLETLG